MFGLRPQILCVDLTALVHLLWRDEALELLGLRGSGKARSRANREDLCETLVRTVPAAQLRQGILSHARRRYWEATIAKSAVAREGLARLGRVFALERKWKSHPPAERTALRQAHTRPHLEAFFAWAEEQFALVKDQRGLLRSALGYSVRNKAALMRYLDDGRLEPTNNGSERALRTIAVGRNAWIFVGSDDHAESAGHLFSLIASARLHALDPEAYLRDLLRVLPHWPRDRFLELAPKLWPRTRARLDPIELAADLGPLTVPPTIEASPEQEPSAQS